MKFKLRRKNINKSLNINKEYIYNNNNYLKFYYKKKNASQS